MVIETAKLQENIALPVMRKGISAAPSNASHIFEEAGEASSHS